MIGTEVKFLLKYGRLNAVGFVASQELEMTMNFSNHHTISYSWPVSYSAEVIHYNVFSYQKDLNLIDILKSRIIEHRK